MFFFFKQKTAYEMRISDWSSDVCSSDLFSLARGHRLNPLGDVGSKGKRRPTERCEIHRFSPSSASRARSYSALANTSHDGGGGAGIAFGGPAGDVFSSTSAASCAAALDPALVSVAGIGSPMRTAAGWMPSETPALPTTRPT